MSLNLIDGDEYFTIDHPGFGDFLVVKSDKLDYFINLINSKKIKSIGISSSKGYDTSNLDFLKECPEIEKIYTVGDGYELQSLNYLKHLTFISTASNIEQVDFSNFPQLSYCCINWGKNVLNLDKCKNLQHLRIYKYKSLQNNLTQLPLFGELKILELVSSSILTLNGIEKYALLTDFKGYYLSKLESIKAITGLKALASLILENCKKIKDFEELRVNQSLIKLILSDCGDIKSIGFIRGLKNLDFFTFVGTNVVDGDMTPCVGLGYFAFTNRKNYSHTMDEVKAKILKKDRPV